MNKLSKLITTLALTALLPITFGCRSGKTDDKEDEFFTSGSREADQRATQRMAREEQIGKTGSGGTSSGEKTEKGEAEQQKTLFERLGGEQGLTAIVDDFVARALQDPRVNWQRKGVTSGGLLRRDKAVSNWTPNPENLAKLKEHIIQFLALTTGGPPNYEGRDMRSVHGNMQITNAEFDAAVGDLKASLDKLRIPDREQKELLAIIETTRPQIVTER